ncbi:hypothetical protein AH70_09715 [Pediococcus damnosus LMG 28219]|uniref:hypothetical protein n=1 Tax=Pediococcus damnosus TaxID=51663 RepID=UPI00061F3787|nr:hypothetical protein [Pediococcus damnosus]KJU73932.1 hypothetical protein AH70_09715 [Pediococcus damnosus LMG 28219]
MSKKLTVFKIFPLILAFGLLIGIVSNIFFPQDVKLSCLVVIACAGLAFVWPLFQTLTNRLSSKSVTRFIISGLLLMVVIQLLVLHFLPVTVYHDPFRVLSQAELLSKNNYSWSNSTYFWRYPNNVSITFLLGQWLKFTNFLGLTTNAGLHFLSLIFLDSFISLSLKNIRRFSKQNGLVLAALIFFLISPFAYTYYLQVFYSDLPAMVCLLFGFNVLMRWPTLSKKNRLFQGLGLFLLILIGQLIKPNLIVFGIAIIVLLGIFLIRNRSQLLIYGIPLAIILIGFGASIPAKAAIQNNVHFTNNTKYELPTANWIWMSYDHKSYGTYSNSAVKKMNTFSTIADRKTYLKKAIPKRIKALGPRGVIEQWLIKTGILLKVGDLQASYSGGLIEAPNIQPKLQIILTMLGSLIMRVGFIFIYGIAFFKCLVMLTAKKASGKPIIGLAVITAVGYLLFHTFVWKTESRYGQALLPLLFIVSAFPTPSILQSTKTFSMRKRGLITGGIAVLAVLVFVTESTSFVRPKEVVVASQRSQLSAQYDAKLATIQPGTTVTQKVKIKQPTTKVSILVPKRAHLTGTLVSLNNQKRYTFKRTKTYFIVHGKFKRGTYQIVLNNFNRKAQKLQIVQTQSYRLAPYPLRIKDTQHAYASLIYTFSNKVSS